MKGFVFLFGKPYEDIIVMFKKREMRIERVLFFSASEREIIFNGDKERKRVY